MNNKFRKSNLVGVHPTTLDSKIDEKLNAAQIRSEREIQEDKENGLDISDIESIRGFDLGYVPLGNSVLLKEIRQDQEIRGIVIPDMSNEVSKAVVIETGTLIEGLRKGDVVTIKPSTSGDRIPSIERTIKGIKFKEYSYLALAGVFVPKVVYMERIKEENNGYKSK